MLIQTITCHIFQQFDLLISNVVLRIQCIWPDRLFGCISRINNEWLWLGNTRNPMHKHSIYFVQNIKQFHGNEEFRLGYSSQKYGIQFSFFFFRRKCVEKCWKQFRLKLKEKKREKNAWYLCASRQCKHLDYLFYLLYVFTQSHWYLKIILRPHACESVFQSNGCRCEHYEEHYHVKMNWMPKNDSKETNIMVAGSEMNWNRYIIVWSNKLNSKSNWNSAHCTLYCIVCAHCIASKEVFNSNIVITFEFKTVDSKIIRILIFGQLVTVHAFLMSLKPEFNSNYRSFRQKSIFNQC